MINESVTEICLGNYIMKYAHNIGYITVTHFVIKILHVAYFMREKKIILPCACPYDTLARELE